MSGKIFLLHFLLAFCLNYFINATTSPPGIDWGQWWTYDGISGPTFWGVINPEWGMCRDGRRQSPINIDPQTLLFDPNLSPFNIDKVTMGGVLFNTGHSVEWRAMTSPQASTIGGSPPKSEESPIVAATGSVHHQPVNVSGGPLSYTYTLTHARLHFGERDHQGSEHLLDNHAFPAELQIFGYNSQLYKNFSHAVGQVYGVVAVALLVKVGETMTPEFRTMLDGIEEIQYGGSFVRSPYVSMKDLLPSTEHYMTYEGSLTEPGCQETVTWIIPNKPLYISTSMMRKLRSVRQGRSEHLSNAPIANNFRPVQTAQHRTVRTNISNNKESKDPRCSVLDSRLVYRANSWHGS